MGSSASRNAATAIAFRMTGGAKHERPAPIARARAARGRRTPVRIAVFRTSSIPSVIELFDVIDLAKHPLVPVWVELDGLRVRLEPTSGRDYRQPLGPVHT